MLFSLKELNIPPTIPFLGIYIEQKLTWKKHCTELRKKLAKNIFIL